MASPSPVVVDKPQTLSSTLVLRSLIKAQHTRCEAHRLWSRTLDEALCGDLTITSYGAKVNTIIAAMSQTSVVFRTARDGAAASDAIRGWAAQVQLLEKELYDATVAIHRVGLTHASLREEEGEKDITLATAVQHNDTDSAGGSRSAGERGELPYASHCADCSIAAAVSALPRGNLLSPSLPVDSSVPVPTIVAAWSTGDCRNSVLFPGEVEDEENTSGNPQGSNANVADTASDDDDDTEGGTDSGSLHQQHQQQRRLTASRRCRDASQEWSALRAETMRLQRLLADLMEEGMELIVDGDE